MSPRLDHGRIGEIALNAIRARAADGQGAPSLTVLANLAQCSDASVRLALDMLIAGGRLEREKRAQNQLRYRVPGGPWTDWSGREKGAAGAAPERKKRRCLRCRHLFDSEWIGNRMCKGCKALASDASPLASSAYAVGRSLG